MNINHPPDTPGSESPKEADYVAAVRDLTSHHWEVHEFTINPETLSSESDGTIEAILVHKEDVFVQALATTTQTSDGPIVRDQTQIITHTSEMAGDKDVWWFDEHATPPDEYTIRSSGDMYFQEAIESLSDHCRHTTLDDGEIRFDEDVEEERVVATSTTEALCLLVCAARSVNTEIQAEQTALTGF